MKIRLKDGRIVDKDEYITAKTKDLQTSGYPSLTEDEVRKQLNSLLTDGPWTNIIGACIAGDLA